MAYLMKELMTTRWYSPGRQRRGNGDRCDGPHQRADARQHLLLVELLAVHRAGECQKPGVAHLYHGVPHVRRAEFQRVDRRADRRYGVRGDGHAWDVELEVVG